MRQLAVCRAPSLNPSAPSPAAASAPPSPGTCPAGGQGSRIFRFHMNSGDGVPLRQASLPPSSSAALHFQLFTLHSHFQRSSANDCRRDNTDAGSVPSTASASHTRILSVRYGQASDGDHDCSNFQQSHHQRAPPLLCRTARTPERLAPQAWAAPPGRSS